MNRSLAKMIRMSAGTISPADKCTRSPTTTSSSGSSCRPVSSLSTQVVVSISADNLAAALPLLVSCTNRRVPEIITIVVIMRTVTASSSPGSAIQISVNADTTARASKIIVNGLTKALQIRISSDSFLPCVTILSPYRPRACSTIPDGSPLPVVSKCFRTACTS